MSFGGRVLGRRIPKPSWSACPSRPPRVDVVFARDPRRDHAETPGAGRDREAADHHRDIETARGQARSPCHRPDEKHHQTTTAGSRCRAGSDGRSPRARRTRDGRTTARSCRPARTSAYEIKSGARARCRARPPCRSRLVPRRCGMSASVQNRPSRRSAGNETRVDDAAHHQTDRGARPTNTPAPDEQQA